MKTLYQLTFVILFVFAFNSCSTQRTHQERNSLTQIKKSHKKSTNSEVMGAEVINEHQFKHYVNIDKNSSLPSSEPLILMEATVDD